MGRSRPVLRASNASVYDFWVSRAPILRRVGGLGEASANIARQESDGKEPEDEPSYKKFILWPVGVIGLFTVLLVVVYMRLKARRGAR